MLTRLSQVAACSAVVLVALAGCAGGDGPQQNGDGPAGSQPGTGEQAPGTGAPPTDEPVGVDIPDRRVDASALPKSYPREVQLADEGTTLIIRAQESGCGKASAELVDETESEVVALLVHTVPAEPRMCTMDIRYPKVTVQLTERLGDRTVVLQAEERKE